MIDEHRSGEVVHQPQGTASGRGGLVASLDRALGLLRADEGFAELRLTRPHPLLVLARVERGAVLLAPAAAWCHARSVFEPFHALLGQPSGALVLLGRPSPPELEAAMQQGLCAMLAEEPTADELRVALRGAFDLIDARLRSESRGRSLNRYRYELGELVEIARALTTERDIDKLLALILTKSRFITGADAGSIYVVEGEDPEPSRRTLRFKLSENESVRFDSREFSMPMSPRSVAGYVALERKAVNIPDVYAPPPDAPYSVQKSYDEAAGYRTKSMLCYPLTSHQGEVIGVIQLINRKRNPSVRLHRPEDFVEHVVSFDERSEELLGTLAAQAGIALDNAILYEENQRMLEGFVRASVEAIEQRDPTTSGHSRRVAGMTVGLAKAVERCVTGPYQDVRWTDDDLRELEYASVLHDFGKIGVREEVLVKAKKLYPSQLDVIRTRFGMAARALEIDLLRRKLEAIRRGATEAELAALDGEVATRRAALDSALALVVDANEPKVIRGGDFQRIEEISRETYCDHEGRVATLLTDAEVIALSIPRGSLTPTEFDEIRSHVVHTFEFLSQIPWGRKLRRVAHIAGAHHERLDGTGYPHRLHGSEIPLQSKIMAVSDIFDALTAADRPYKKAVPVGRALDILGMEVNDGHVDAELVRVFAEAKVWEELPDPPKD